MYYCFILMKNAIKKKVKNFKSQWGSNVEKMEKNGSKHT